MGADEDGLLHLTHVGGLDLNKGCSVSTNGRRDERKRDEGTQNSRTLLL